MVIALDQYKRPLGFVTERRARKLFEKKRAVCYRHFPTVIIIKDIDSRTMTNLPEYQIKIDPGSKTDGIAIVDENQQKIVWAMQINPCGIIVKKLKPRAKRIFGFMNGDIVMAEVPEGYKAAGYHVGRVTVRADGYLYIRTTQNTAINVRKDFVKLLQYADGYRCQLCRTKNNQGIV